MNTVEILKNISERTNGDIYLGVVGPVRVGKSTFIKTFMEKAVLPYISDEFEKARMIDELPQSGMGKTIMTTEPKFVPNNAANITFEDGFSCKIRLIDCVGYIIDEAKGYKDENGVRMVRTPWFEDAIPFHEAAKVGTQKVISDHSTIGIVITTDGSITDLTRDCYIEAENEVITELQNIGKPFIIIVNSKYPESATAKATADKIKEKYDVPVLIMSIESMREEDVLSILRSALYEFPISEININLEKWVTVLDEQHWLKESIHQTIENSLSAVKKLKDVENIIGLIEENEYLENVHLESVDTGKGTAFVECHVKAGLYHEILKEIIGYDISDKAALISVMQDFAIAKKEYDSVASALKMVKQTGYGFASSSLSDIQLSTPEIMKVQNRYGVRLKAIAPSIHMIKVDVESVFEPIIGSKEQSEELLRYLLRDHETDKNAIWESDIFGRKLSDLVKDGMNAKLSVIPETTRVKLQSIMTKLVNKGKGNVIAIVL